MNYIASIWGNIVKLGTSSGMEFDEKRRLRILNSMALAFGVFTFFNALWGLALKMPFVMVVNYIDGFLMVIVLLMNHRRKYNTALVLFFIPLAVHIGIIEFLLNVGAHFFLFPLFILAAFILRQNKWLYAYFGFLVIIYVLSESSLLAFIKLPVDVDLENGITIIDGVMAFMFTIFSVNLFRSQYAESRRNILSKNKQLEKAVELADERAKFARLLLREMNHRVKNNLQLISSLLNIHAAQLENKAAQKEVMDAKRRISAIALIHRQLYKEGHDGKVGMKEYISDLVPFIKETLLKPDTDCDIQLSVSNFSLRLEDAVSVGLIVNECLTNSIRHGIVNKVNAKIDLLVERLEKELKIKVIDTGIGIEQMNKEEGRGFGFQLISTIVENFDGNIEIDNKLNSIIITLKYSEMR